MSRINRELEKPPVEPPPLDPELFKPSESELQFLKSSISKDFEVIKEKVLEAQKDDEYPYPCIRAFHFVSLMMSQNPAYSKIIESARNENGGSLVFLDLGCCMGTDVRKLAKDGYPASSIIGCDIRPSYISLGYKLYGDSPSSLPIRFITGDIFSLPASPNKSTLGDHVESLDDLRGKVTHLYTGALFHLFDEETQFVMAQRIALLVTRNRSAIIFGRHQGKAQESMVNDHLGRSRYGHSPNSWTNMWRRVFSESDGEDFVKNRLEVKAELSVDDMLHGIPIEYRQLTWSVHLRP